MKQRARVKRLRHPPRGTVLRDDVDVSASMAESFVVLVEPRADGFWRAKGLGGVDLVVHYRAWA